MTMSDEKRCKSEHLVGPEHGYNHRHHGPSSFTMHDPELVFNELKLKEGDSFLDLGCGAGDYSLYAARLIGNSGIVYALDVQKEILHSLAEEAALQKLKNIRTKISNINNPLALVDDCIDVCFIATVLHTLELVKVGDKLFNEIRRVLKPQGRLAIIELKKEDMPFGPPMHKRHSPEELEEIIRPAGFERLNYVDLGYNYLLHFHAK